MTNNNRLDTLLALCESVGFYDHLALLNENREYILEHRVDYLDDLEALIKEEMALFKANLLS